MSQIATGVAWRPFQSTFWLRSQGSLGTLLPRMGSSASALVGPSEGHTSSPGPLVPLLLPLIPGTAAGKPQPVWLASPCGLCRRGQAAGQPLLLFLLGRLLEVTAQPQNDQLLFLCHMGHQKGIIALQTLVLLPLLGAPAVSQSPGLCGQL